MPASIVAGEADADGDAANEGDADGSPGDVGPGDADPVGTTGAQPLASPATTSHVTANGPDRDRDRGRRPCDAADRCRADGATVS